MKLRFATVLVCVLFLSITSDLQKKFIRNGDYDIECYVSLKNIKYHEDNKMYYWFKANEIHKSLSSSGGFVLHDSYKMFYRTNQLAEEGTFVYGLKDGVWKDWHENGNLRTEASWKNGFKNGKYTSYDIFGNLESKGTYRNDLKTGRWINYKTKDTVNFKKNEIVVKKPDDGKDSFFKRLFTKRDSIQKVQYKLERQTKKKNDSIEKALNKRKKEVEKKKDTTLGFFKKLFRKKE
jgi:hypothetical protein